MKSNQGVDLIRLLGYLAALMLVGSIVYAIINGILAESVGLNGGVPEVDLEASLVVGTIGFLLLVGLAFYKRLKK